MIFEDDTLEIIQFVKRKSYCWEWHGQLIEDIKLNLYNKDTWSIQ